MMPKKSEKKKKALLICFMGIDGAGKTTLGEMIAHMMNRNGIKSKYMWCGWRQFDSVYLRPFAVIFKKLFIHRASDNMNHNASGEVIENRFLDPFLRYLMLFDYLISAFPKVKIPLMSGQSIVSDRYIYDLKVESMLKNTSRGNALLDILPKPDFTFLIDLPEEVAYQRKDDIPSIEYLRAKRQLYLDFAEKNINKEKLLILDGSEDISNIEKLVNAKIAEILKDQCNFLMYEYKQNADAN